MLSEVLNTEYPECLGHRFLFTVQLSEENSSFSSLGMRKIGLLCFVWTRVASFVIHWKVPHEEKGRKRLDLTPSASLKFYDVKYT